MSMQRITSVLALIITVALVLPAEAQRGKGRGKRAGKNGLAGPVVRGPMKQELFSYLYPVRLVRHYADDIKLTEEQVKKLRQVVTDVRSEIEQLRWDAEQESIKLVKLVKSGASKERIYTQMDRIFKYENKAKKKHLGLMIVVRDILNAQQRAYLDKVKAEFSPAFGGPSWVHGPQRGRGGGPPGPGSGPPGQGPPPF